jgi:hypothetical protein
VGACLEDDDDSTEELPDHDVDAAGRPGASPQYSSSSTCSSMSVPEGPLKKLKKRFCFPNYISGQR